MQVIPNFNEFTGFPHPEHTGIVGYGACTRCSRERKPGDPGVVDTDIQFYGEGVVMLCWPCATLIGELVGMVDADKAKNLKEQSAFLKVRLDAADTELAVLRSMRDSFEDALKVADR